MNSNFLQVPFFALALLFSATSTMVIAQPTPTNNLEQSIYTDQIIDIFFSLDKSMEQAKKIVDNATTNVFEIMQETVKSKIQYRILVDKAVEVRKITQEYNEYIDDVRVQMIEESGGYYTEETAKGNLHLIGKPIGKKNKDVPQRIFESGDYTGAENLKPENFEVPVGPDLDNRISELKNKYIALLEELWEYRNTDGTKGIEATIFAAQAKKEGVIKELEAKMTFMGSSNYNAADHDGQSWAAYTFGGLPVAAIYPILRKYQADAQTTEALVITFLAAQMGRLERGYDKVAVFSSSPKNYILRGETYESYISLGAYSTKADFSVSVGGRNLMIVDGKAKYTAKPSRIGEHSYTATIRVRNPLTGGIDVFQETFNYEVGAASISVAADKMNVLYVGVDNPITIAASDIPTSALKISVVGGVITSSGGYNNYTVQVEELGTVTVLVTDSRTGKTYSFPFRAKRIPDPVVKLSNKVGGLMGAGEFRAQLGLIATLPNFDFDARCSVESYIVHYTAEGQETIKEKGIGARFSGEVPTPEWLSASEYMNKNEVHTNKVDLLVQQAVPGSQYSFTDVQVRCPGDKEPRRVNDLSFEIK